MNRTRLTITLKKDLVHLLDQSIDGTQVRNRSHAIEQLLSEVLDRKLPPLVVLAGGRQVRFPHISASDLPKCLLPVGGVPLLEHTLKRAKQVGFSEVYISVGPGGQKVKDYFRDGSKLGLKIKYVEQSSGVPGTAQALSQLKSELSGRQFLLLYGDVLTYVSFSDLLEFHRLHTQHVCTMLLTSVEHVKSWGLARLAGSKVAEFVEKPKNPTIRSHLINAGVYVMDGSIFEYIDSQSNKLETSVFPRLAEEGRLGGYVYEGPWFDVSSEETYRAVLEFLSRGQRKAL